MNDELRKVAADLQAKPSGEAADWLLQHYPSGGDAIALLEHLSLRKADTRRLASHYLGGATHANTRAYRLFAERLGLGELVGVLAETDRRSARDGDLLAYHLRPLVDETRDPEERRTAAAFLASLASS